MGLRFLYLLDCVQSKTVRLINGLTLPFILQSLAYHPEGAVLLFHISVILGFVPANLLGLFPSSLSSNYLPSIHGFISSNLMLLFHLFSRKNVRILHNLLEAKVSKFDPVRMITRTCSAVIRFVCR